MTANNSIDSPKDSDQPKRELWSNKAEFVLSCVGLSVGIGNVWRFPYLAYENGGGAFLLPYFILLLLVGKPMYFLELALGQYTSLGPLSIWRCFPIAKGVGAAMVVVSVIVAVYYNVIMAYTIFYMAQSFRSVLPWSDCFEWWGANSSTCYVRSSNRTRCTLAVVRLAEEFYNATSYRNNTVVIQGATREVYVYVPESIFTETMSTCTNATQTASEQFWERYVLDISPGIDTVGSIKWDLALCLLASWIIIFFCLIKGIKSSGKVVYFTATFPYVVLIAFVIYGVTLNGATDGLYFFFVPNWDKVLQIKVWQRAAEQLFYSLAVSWGGLILFGSYNPFDNKVHRDALFVSSLDFITSVLAGVVIFSVLGNMAKESGLNIEDVVQQGQGLAFVAYPEALARLWFPQLWSFLFFIMLYLLGVDSEFALLETFLTALCDEFPKLRNYKSILTFLTCTVCFFLGLTCVTQGGQYVFSLMDSYSASVPLMFIAIWELISLTWGYGICRLSDNLEFMLGFRPGIYFQGSWLVVSPIILTFLFISGLIDYTPITYNNNQPYPNWANGIGWLLALLSMVQIPIWALVVLCQNRKNFRNAFRPTEDWGPGDEDAKRKQLDMELTIAFTKNDTNKLATISGSPVI